MKDRKLAAELCSNSQLNVEGVLLSFQCREAMVKDMREEMTRAQENVKSAQAEVKNEHYDVDSIHRKQSQQRRYVRDRNADPDGDS
jgi:hypothetical protein